MSHLSLGVRAPRANKLSLVAHADILKQGNSKRQDEEASVYGIYRSGDMVTYGSEPSQKWLSFRADAIFGRRLQKLRTYPTGILPSR